MATPPTQTTHCVPNRSSRLIGGRAAGGGELGGGGVTGGGMIGTEAAMAGLLVYLTLNLFLVRPMQRITHAMERFRADPEDGEARVILTRFDCWIVGISIMQYTIFGIWANTRIDQFGRRGISH